MGHRKLALVFAAVLVYYGGVFALAVWRPFFAGPFEVYVLITLPALVLGVFGRQWELMGVPLSVWVLGALVFTVVTDDTGDFGRVGLFFFLLFFQTPVIALAFVLGRVIRHVAYTARGR